VISQKILDLGVNRLIGEVKDVRTLDGLDASSFDVAIDKGAVSSSVTVFQTLTPSRNDGCNDDVVH
jgi:hypothetical protein